MDLFRRLMNYQQVRYRIWSKQAPITGWPRKHLWNKCKPYPESHIYNYRPYLPEEYTIRPLPIHKMGGRSLETGRVVVKTLGGGNPKKFRWVDTFRKSNEDGTVKEERVLMLKYSPLHSPKLALVADAERTRWILATHGIEVGDIIRTYSEIPKNPIQAKDGDAHPVGALPLGVKVSQIETKPGTGAKFCLVAGSCGEIVKRTSDRTTVKLPSGNSIVIDPKCMVVVGQNSNIDHQYVQLWCPQRLRWLGKRPRSGLRHKKDGYCGRKINPPKVWSFLSD